MKLTYLALCFLSFVISLSSYGKDRLVLVSASYGKNILAITDAKGDVLWSYKTAGREKGHAGHHDVHMLKNGNILFHETWQDVKEINLKKKIVWKYDCATANGNRGKGVNVHAFSRLANGHTQIVESGVGRVIDVDRNGKLIRSFDLKPGGTASTRWARATPQGTLLVCSEQPGVVTEYDKKGKVVWEIKGKVPGTDIELKWMTCLQEMENGNFIVGNCHAGPDNPQIFEITRDNKVIWEFNEFGLVGNGLACWQVLDGEQDSKLRKKLSAIQ